MTCVASRRSWPLRYQQLDAQHHHDRLFHQAADAAGITRPVTVRSLRHSFATHLLDAGVNIRVIQALLGHTKLITTSRYTRIATAMITAIESPIDVLGDCKVNKVKRKKKTKPKT